MTPKEKAIELVEKYRIEMYDMDNLYAAKQCAIIAVDELIKDNSYNEEIVNGGLNKLFWQEVKFEIEKL